ncbi:MAG: phosphoadenylyl-sulfate reductase [Rhodospirillaceae bacterium]|nr:phosphoadenylyl-sulfate reductase [Rhodospirillaceae bacterium]
MTMDWKAEVTRLRASHGGLDGLALVRELLRDPALRGRTAVVSSFGAESAVLLDMVATVDPSTPVIFLDTGKVFAETLAYRDELTALLGLRDVRSVEPEATDMRQHDADGDLWRKSPDFCCHLRKTAPLHKALSGFSAWITGRKRFQGGLRTELAAIEAEPAHARLKFNPLATWSEADIEDYRRLRHLPAHPLVADGYLSIGCVPCTRPVQPGEDPRAGRWWGLDKTECGIHLAR